MANEFHDVADDAAQADEELLDRLASEWPKTRFAGYLYARIEQDARNNARTGSAASFSDLMRHVGWLLRLADPTYASNIRILPCGHSRMTFGKGEW